MAEMRRYKVLSGGHSGPDYTKPPILAEDGTPVAYPRKRYSRNDLVHSEIDLAKKYPHRFADAGPSKYTNVVPRTKKVHRGTGLVLAAPEARAVHGHARTEAEENAIEEAKQALVRGEEADTGTDDDEEAETEDEEDEDEEEQGVDTAATLKAMTLEELRDLAKEEKIDIRGAANKDAVIKKILAAKG